MSLVSNLAASTGTSEAALKLILGQMSGYPLMLIYRSYLSRHSVSTQHIFFFLTGLSAGLWVIGPDVVHSIYAVLATYMILFCAGGSLASVVISFVFNMGYLTIGYLCTESEGYDILWTMPHCVLCLRLIGLTFDCYDGEMAKQKGPEILSKDQKQSALSELPSLLEMLSHSFFIGGYFVGPQITMKKYRNFVRPDYYDSLPGSPLTYGFQRLGLGLIYMLVHVVGSIWVPDYWPNTQHFYDISLLTKIVLLPIWTKVFLARYIFAWLTAEGVCVISGLSFNGVDKDGSVDWSGCANVKVGRLESAHKFDHYVESFNINTNHWVAVYVYKRLKFLGDRNVSQIVTLLFLAVWHGNHSGYFVTFAHEFFTMKVEKEFFGVWSKSDKVEKLMKVKTYSMLAQIAGWVYVVILLPHCFLAFGLLTWNKFLPAYTATYFIMYIWWLIWSFWGYGYVKKVLGNSRQSEKKEVVETKMENILEEDENVDKSGDGNVPNNVIDANTPSEDKKEV